MRLALWFLGLFGVAVALALFASHNTATITVFWPPHRVDLSLNMVVLLLGLLFVLLHLALKALSALFDLPTQARSWRLRHQERMIYGALLDAIFHFVAGRYLRARKAALTLLEQEAALSQSGEDWPQATRLRVMAHLLAAESSQALQDHPARESHFQQAMQLSHLRHSGGIQEGLLLRAVRWSLQDSDAHAALRWLELLPSGVARRTVALRMRLKVARLAGKQALALETARLLAKHRAFSPDSAKGLIRSLAQDWLLNTFDVSQLEQVWAQLEAHEKSMPEVACAGAGRALRLGGSPGLAFDWLLPVWDHLVKAPQDFSSEQKTMLVRVMENAFSTSEGLVQSPWLARVERAREAYPGEVLFQYLAGVACFHAQLWGKAHQLLTQALPRLEDEGLQAKAWQILAELAQRLGDESQAAAAWREAAQLRLRRKG
ncbi:MAG: heme biosynthesis HemY N-terminal domain-containing protein [Rhodoferax sp.]|nr:heme biosynthesis HemY N-terminal domain-containing protein [Rhodoferax sp.]